jgi:hypothetical protein
LEPADQFEIEPQDPLVALSGPLHTQRFGFRWFPMFVRGNDDGSLQGRPAQDVKDPSHDPEVWRRWTRQEFPGCTLALADERFDGFEVRQYSRQDIQAQLEQAYALLTAPDDGPAFTSTADLRGPSGRRFVVKPLLSPGRIALLLAQPGNGKSTLSVHLAQCIARERPFLGFTTKGAAVAYVAAEARQDTLDRFYGWDTHHAGGIAAPRPIDVYPRVNLMSTEDVHAFHSALLARQKQTGVKLGLIIFDTLAACAPAPENDDTTMKRVMNAASELADKQDCAVLILHHPIKSDEDTERGSGALRGALDLVWKLKREPGLRMFRLELGKQRATELDAEPIFRLTGVPIGEWEDGDTISVAVVEEVNRAEFESKPRRPREGTKAAAGLRVLEMWPAGERATPTAEQGMDGAKWTASKTAWHRAIEAAVPNCEGRQVAHDLLNQPAPCVRSDGSRVWLIGGDLFEGEAQQIEAAEVAQSVGNRFPTVRRENGRRRGRRGASETDAKGPKPNSHGASGQSVGSVGNRRK